MFVLVAFERRLELLIRSFDVLEFIRSRVQVFLQLNDGFSKFFNLCLFCLRKCLDLSLQGLLQLFPFTLDLGNRCLLGRARFLQLTHLVLMFVLHLNQLGLYVLELLQGGLLLRTDPLKIILFGGKLLLHLALSPKDSLLFLFNFGNQYFSLSLFELFLFNFLAKKIYLSIWGLYLVGELLDSRLLLCDKLILPSFLVKNLLLEGLHECIHDFVAICFYLESIFQLIVFLNQPSYCMVLCTTHVIQLSQGLLPLFL